MEHEEKPLPIEHKMLGDQAIKYMAYAKALHYKELEFFSDPSPAVIESLQLISSIGGFDSVHRDCHHVTGSTLRVNTSIIGSCRIHGA
jgi:hypothetical protein